MRIPPSALSLIAASLLLASPGGAQTLDGCDLAGRWTMPDGVGQVEFVQEDGRWLGRLVTLPEEPREGIDVGWEMVREVEVNEGKRRYDAKLHPERDRRISAEIKCLEDGRLEVKGKVAFLRRTMRWTRATPPASAPSSPSSADSRRGSAFAAGSRPE